MRQRLTTLLALTAMMLLLASAATQNTTIAMGAMDLNSTVAAQQNLNDTEGGLLAANGNFGIQFYGQQVANVRDTHDVATTNLAATRFYDQNGTGTDSGPPSTFQTASLTLNDPWTTIYPASLANGPPNTFDAALNGSDEHVELSTNGEVAYDIKCPLMGANLVTRSTEESTAVLRT